ncbi:hypothetical protein GCM10022204_18950 [Microlunatus aurantiacus]|uniref:Phosphoserine phosphatase RsbU N-terminal domain-containing protein n=1 Tax=Microlunatus aurantiacus TaxID=446786 RepID=A0ABP7DBU5_9ACTN
MTVNDLDQLRRSYRAAFLHCLTATDERALLTGYDIGRAAVVARLSLLDVAQTHHQLLAEVLRTSPTNEVEKITQSASDFFVEVLAAFDMAQRVLPLTPGDPQRER